jgi:hypothetical protein
MAMSYARFGPDSDVHVIRTAGAPYSSVPAWACINCYLGKDFETTEPDAMIEHLRCHNAAGHKVPSEVFVLLLDIWVGQGSCWVGQGSCAEPVVLFRGGYDDPAEISEIQRVFPCVTTRGKVPRSRLVIGRYSVLPFYKELCEDLAARGSYLINTYSQHRYLADMGNWYRDLRGVTPDTWTELAAVPDDAWPCVLKGETNSKKWQWKTHMFAAGRQQAMEVEGRLRADGLLCDQSIYYRRYVPLDKVCEQILTNGPPTTREFRFFVCDGQVLTGGFYWSGSLDEGVAAPNPSEVPRALLANVIERVGANARFYVVDVAKTQSGDWIVVELNDGQMSGLSDNDPAHLYRRLHEVLCPEEETE